MIYTSYPPTISVYDGFYYYTVGRKAMEIIMEIQSKSSMGELVISDEVVASIAINAAKDVDGVSSFHSGPVDVVSTIKQGSLNPSTAGYPSRPPPDPSIPAPSAKSGGEGKTAGPASCQCTTPGPGQTTGASVHPRPGGRFCTAP